MNRRCALLLPLLLAGCFNELSWKTIPGSLENNSVRRLHFRSADEIWLVGTSPMLVRTKGEWSVLSLCFEERAVLADVGFEADGAVWAHCVVTTAVDTHTLWRYDAQRVAQPVPLPAGETKILLVQTGDTVRFFGAKRFYSREAGAWKELAPYTFRGVYGGIGTSPDDFLLSTDTPEGVLQASRWDKDHFALTTLDSFLPVRAMLRGGELFAGTARVVAGELVPLSESPDTAGRGVRAASALDPRRIAYFTMPASTAFDSVSGGGIWLSKSAGDLDFQGHAPFSSGNLARGGGIAFFHALDEDHYLIGVAGGAAGGPISGDKVVEGTR